MNGVAIITASDEGRADAALVQRFRQAQTARERTAVFADVVRQHRHAVLFSCAEQLWPDADAAVAAAGDVLVAARLAMADSAKLPHPDRLHGWLLGIAVQTCPVPGLPASIDDLDWEAVRARIAAADAPETRDSLAGPAWSRQWLERIVATLPEPRQRMYDLFVTRGLDSRSAALELGTTVAEVRRLRRENRHAILRAFEVTALAAEAAAEAAVDLPGTGASWCGELRQALADAQPDDGDPPDKGRHRVVVLPAALRLTLSRHLSQCGACQDRRDDCMVRWAPGALPIVAEAELYEQVMEDVQSIPEPRQPGAAPGAHRRVTSAGTGATVVIRRPAAVAAGAGLLLALLLLAFVWPGVGHGTQAPTALVSSGRNGAFAGGAGAPKAAGTFAAVSGDGHGRSAPAGLLSSVPPAATGSPAAHSSGTVQPSVYYTIPPSTAPTSSPTQSASPSPSSPGRTTTSPTPSQAPSTRPPSTSPTSPAPSTPTPTPSASTSTPTPTPSASTSTPTPTPSASTSTPTPTASASAASPSPSASSSSPAPSPSTVTTSASATS